MNAGDRGKVGPPRILREGLWIGAGQAASMLAALVGVRLLTTLLSPSVYGQVALLLGLATLGTGLFCHPILQASLRFYTDALRSGNVNALRTLSYRYLKLGLALMGVLLLTGGAAWTARPSSGVSYDAFLLVGFFLVADAIRSMEASLLNAARRQMDFSLRNVLDAWARPIAATTAVLVLGASPVNVLLGYAVGSAAVSGVLRRRIVRGADGPAHARDDSWSEKNRRPFLAYALPIVPLCALNWIMSLGDRYILAGVSGTHAAGLYAAAYGLGSQPFIIVNGIIHSTLRPVLYDAASRGDRDKERRTLWIWLGMTLAVSGGGVGLVYFLAEGVTHLLLGKEYWSAAPLLLWIAGAYALQNLQSVFEIMMFADGQTRRVAALYAIAAGVGLTLYVFLIPQFGAKGAAAGTLATFVVTCSSSFVFAGAHRRLMGGRSKEIASRSHPDSPSTHKRS